jgi:hypothetical protein
MSSVFVRGLSWLETFVILLDKLMTLHENGGEAAQPNPVLLLEILLPGEVGGVDYQVSWLKIKSDHHQYEFATIFAARFQMQRALLLPCLIVGLVG